MGRPAEADVGSGFGATNAENDPHAGICTDPVFAELAIMNGIAENDHLIGTSGPKRRRRIVVASWNLSILFGAKESC